MLRMKYSILTMSGRWLNAILGMKRFHNNDPGRFSTIDSDVSQIDACDDYAMLERKMQILQKQEVHMMDIHN